MSSIKNILNRYFKSLNAVFWILYYKLIRKKDLYDLFNKEFINVHIICPGPSANNFFTSKYTATKEDAIILVNHALNLYPQLKKYTDNIFYFSSDGSRVKESIKMKSEIFNEVFSVISSVHLFHLNKFIIKKINVITLPRLTFKRDFGFVGINQGPENFDELKIRSIASGFGSLIYSLQLAVKFNPKNLRLWGCDFGDNKGKRYITEDIPIRKTEAFEKTKIHFKIVEQIIKNKGINITIK